MDVRRMRGRKRDKEMERRKNSNRGVKCVTLLSTPEQTDTPGLDQNVL